MRAHAGDAPVEAWISHSEIVPVDEIWVGDEILISEGYVKVRTIERVSPTIKRLTLSWRRFRFNADFHICAPVRRSTEGR